MSVVDIFPEPKSMMKHVKSKQFKADVIMMDTDRPGKRGREYLNEIKRLRPKAKVIILTDMSDSMLIRDFLSWGADGFLVKKDDPNLIVPAIRSVFHGKFHITQTVDANDFGTIQARAALNLSRRELEVLALVADGKTSQDIGKLLGITKRTVEFHRSQLLTKFKADNSIVMINNAKQYKLI